MRPPAAARKGTSRLGLMVFFEWVTDVIDWYHRHNLDAFPIHRLLVYYPDPQVTITQSIGVFGVVCRSSSRASTQGSIDLSVVIRDSLFYYRRQREDQHPEQ